MSEVDQPMVAVVEDDDALREQILLPLLRASGFRATGLASALALYRDLVANRYDLVLLDVGLPDEDGVEVARHLRKAAPATGLVMLSGYISDRDRLRGLEAGVDAYLNKPVESETLVATLRNVSRRVGVGAGEAAGRWRLDTAGWRILLPDGRAVAMSLPEQQIMRLLAAVPGTPVRRDRLMASLSDDLQSFDPHRLEMLVYRLRRKCQDATGVCLPLQTVRGVGYVLAW